MINLVKDTIDNEDINELIEWLKTYPRLTKSSKTLEFEELWCKYLGCKYSVFVNSGSSANLAMIYVSRLLQENKGDFINKRIIIPAVSWATDLSPAIQLDFQPYLCEVSKDDLGVDINHFEQLCKESHCKTAIVVHVLGIPAQMDKIKEICNKYNVMLIEDCCESLGSTYKGKMTGTFGQMSSFSFYFGHHMSTIEGGMISTDNKEIYDLLKMVRSHGWDRELDLDKQRELRTKYGISDFDALYTFYVPGFNIRPTDLHSFIGIGQLEKVNNNNQKRFENFNTYQSKIKNEYWKIKERGDFISNFAYPIIHPKRDQIAKALLENNIECRPLISGSLGNHPVFKEMKMEKWLKDSMIKDLPYANIIHKFGMYIPNNPLLTENEINLICDIVNNEIG
jgi:CDP-6-deoxy-D-xylo-4-hexulose-3-dehydrase